MVEKTMNLSIPFYHYGAVSFLWDNIQIYLACCGVKTEFQWGGWVELRDNWRVTPSCCKPSYMNICMENPSNTSAYLTGCLPEVMPFVKIMLFEIRIMVFFCLALTIAVFEAILQERNLGQERTRRIVKLGRKYVPPIFQHWAVKVENNEEDEESYWYEVGRDGLRFSGIVSQRPGNNVVTRGKGKIALSTAGKWGGEIVGWTTKTDQEILGTELMEWIGSQTAL